MFRKYGLKPVFVILQVVMLAYYAHAQPSWLESVNDCDELRAKLAEYYRELREVGHADAEELRGILNVACGQKFLSCGFSVCARFDSKDGVHEQDLPPRQSIIQRDALAWLASELSCNALRDNIYARYSPLGEFQALPEEVRAELLRVRQEVCSERFQHCGFTECKEGGQHDVRLVVAITSANAQSTSVAENYDYETLLLRRKRAEDRLRASVHSYQTQLRKRIESQRINEERRGLKWERFTISPTTSGRPETESITGPRPITPQEGSSPLYVDRGAPAPRPEEQETTALPVQTERPTSTTPRPQVIPGQGGVIDIFR